MSAPDPDTSGKHVLEFAPPMPPDFWGEVVFRYQDGKFVSAEVKRTFKK